MARALEKFFGPANYKNHPDRGFFTMPVEEAQSLPLGQKAKAGKRNIQYDVYLSRQNYTDGTEVRRGFSERRSAGNRISGRRKVTPPEYADILTETGVPTPPAEDNWRVTNVFYVPQLRSLAVVEMPQDDTQQSRVTRIGQRRISRKEPYVDLPDGQRAEYQRVSLKEYVAILQALGFPKGTFEGLNRSMAGRSDMSGTAEQTLQDIKPLYWLVDQVIVRPIRAVSERAHRHGRFIDTIRTNNPRTHSSH